jgi:FkbM family methyltransferase
LELFADQPRGSVLDIGAYDGTTFSNTRALIERGWGGVLVEPEPAAFLKLFELYKDRADIRLVNACAGVDFHLTRFWHTADMVGTTDEEHYTKWQGCAAYDGMYYVACVPVWDLYATAVPDLVNIDVEGGSARLAIHMLVRGLAPRVLCVEHDGLAQRILEQAVVYGYREVTRNGENLILAR